MLAAQVERVRAVGGTVECSAGGWRVEVDSPCGLWRVAVARSLGGTEWLAGGISNAAEVAWPYLSPLRPNLDIAYVIVATDGVWGAFDALAAADSLRGPEEVAAIVDWARTSGLGAGEAAQAVISAATRKRSTDNKACCVLYLQAESV